MVTFAKKASAINSTRNATEKKSCRETDCDPKRGTLPSDCEEQVLYERGRR